MSRGYDYRLDMNILERVYTPNPDRHQALRFLCEGDNYLFWGFIPARFHLVCPKPRAVSSSCSAPTGWAGDLLSRITSTGRGFR